MTSYRFPKDEVPTLQAGSHLLRQPANTDAESLWENATRHTTMTASLLWPTHASAQETGKVLHSFRDQITLGKAWHWVIEVNGQAVGETSVRFGLLPDELAKYAPAADQKSSWLDPGTQVAGEIGYFLGPDYWGQGIMTASVRAMVQYMQSSYPEIYLWATVDPANIGSVRVLEKSGLSRRYVVQGNAHLPNQGNALRDTAYYLL